LVGRNVTNQTLPNGLVGLFEENCALSKDQAQDAAMAFMMLLKMIVDTCTKPNMTEIQTADGLQTMAYLFERMTDIELKVSLFCNMIEVGTSFIVSNWRDKVVAWLHTCTIDPIVPGVSQRVESSHTVGNQTTLFVTPVSDDPWTVTSGLTVRDQMGGDNQNPFSAWMIGLMVAAISVGVAILLYIFRSSIGSVLRSITRNRHDLLGVTTHREQPFYQTELVLYNSQTTPSLPESLKPSDGDDRHQDVVISMPAIFNRIDSSYLIDHYNLIDDYNKDLIISNPLKDNLINYYN